MTPCQKLGYNVGDKFVVIKEDILAKGSIVTLYKDDGSDLPIFKSIVGGVEFYISIEEIEKIEYTNKYARIIYGVEVDVYDVLVAWNVTCPATQHAIKKLLMPGQRGSKDKLQDLEEAKQAIERAIELNR
mgnify:CR=1 FL=1